ncbi:hypothetical protein J2X71_004192 [Rhizobium sp. 1399]|jgi:hypothetical protein|nr:hypothetical protein [Rhizobium sp. 1399]
MFALILQLWHGEQAASRMRGPANFSRPDYVRPHKIGSPAPRLAVAFAILDPACSPHRRSSSFTLSRR